MIFHVHIASVAILSRRRGSSIAAPGVGFMNEAMLIGHRHNNMRTLKQPLTGHCDFLLSQKKTPSIP